ncbi:hypothetical protein [Nakamurella alba]|uniref:hypothetical protein n=1 Tax=Nakamurella alba TaxID=2665158 RepID=UPI0018AC1247|nr:hypothetical protein [Nakamurella alba]
MTAAYCTYCGGRMAGNECSSCHRRITPHPEYPGGPVAVAPVPVAPAPAPVAPVPVPVPMPPPPAAPPPRNSQVSRGTTAGILVLVLVLAAGAFGGWWFFLREPGASAQSTAPSSASATSASPPLGQRVVLGSLAFSPPAGWRLLTEGVPSSYRAAYGNGTTWADSTQRMLISSSSLADTTPIADYDAAARKALADGWQRALTAEVARRSDCTPSVLRGRTLSSQPDWFSMDLVLQCGSGTGGYEQRFRWIATGKGAVHRVVVTAGAADWAAGGAQLQAALASAAPAG